MECKYKGTVVFFFGLGSPLVRSTINRKFRCHKSCCPLGNLMREVEREKVKELSDPNKKLLLRYPREELWASGGGRGDRARKVFITGPKLELF